MAPRFGVQLSGTSPLLRQYFPKRADLRTYTLDDFRRVEDLLNNRPRKTLGWATPTALFTSRCQDDQANVATIG